VDSVHGAVDHADPVHRGLAAIAASLSSSELGLRFLRRLRSPDEGRRRKREARGPGSGLTGARKAAERRRDDGEGGCRGELSAGLLGARREEKEGRGRSGEERGFRGTLL
jgi:hypothetical protein